MLEGLPKLRAELDQAYRLFRADPSFDNARALHNAIRVYGEALQVDNILTCDECGSVGARLVERNPYNRMMDGNFCRQCVAGA